MTSTKTLATVAALGGILQFALGLTAYQIDAATVLTSDSRRASRRPTSPPIRRAGSSGRRSRSRRLVTPGESTTSTLER
jgi:hypothetical protein